MHSLLQWIGSLIAIGVLSLIGALLFIFVRHVPQRLRAREIRRAAAHLEIPWRYLFGTGNGIGGAPASIRKLPSLDDDGFDELLLGELLDKFWHQGTIYAATPFAIDEVLRVLPKTKAAHHEDLLLWIGSCLESEALGATSNGGRAGLFIPEPTKVALAANGVVVPSCAEIVRSHKATLQPLLDACAPSLHNALWAALRG